MPVAFQSVPSNIRKPSVYSEAQVTQSQAGLPLKQHKALLVGSKVTAGSMSHLAAPALVTSIDQVAALAGYGSVLYEMALAFFASNRFTPLYIISVDDSGGTAATFTLTVTVSSNLAGTINLYIAGHRVQINTTAAQAQNSIATAIAAAVTADGTLPVTASSSTNVVTLTARNKGVVTSDIDVRLNYNANESLPSGVSIAIAAGVAGATNPTLGATLWAAIGEDQYDEIAFAWNDSSNMGVVNTELVSRWGPTRKNDGSAYFGYRGTFSAAQTAGLLLNSQFLNVLPLKNSPTWTPAIGASLAARAAAHYSQDPALPLNQRALDFISAPAPADRYIWSEQNSLLYAGMSTANVLQGGSVVIDRHVTTYQKNSAGGADNAWLDATTQACASYVRWVIDTTWSAKYPRMKFAKDGTAFGPGQLVMTPQLARSEFIGIYQQLMLAGIAEDIESFKLNLICEQNSSDPTRLDVVFPLYLVNPLHVVAVQINIVL